MSELIRIIIGIAFAIIGLLILSKDKDDINGNIYFVGSIIILLS